MYAQKEMQATAERVGEVQPGPLPQTRRGGAQGGDSGGADGGGAAAAADEADDEWAVEYIALRMRAW